MESSNIRTAAISAFRNSLPIFLATVAIIPAISIFRRVFDDTWYVNWSSMLLVSGILTGCFFAFFLIAQTPDLSPTTKREHERPSDFPAVKWLRGVYLLGVLIGFALMIGIYKGGNLWWIVALLLGFVLVGFFAWPRVIQITALEIRQRGPLLALKRIANAEIEDLIFNQLVMKLWLLEQMASTLFTRRCTLTQSDSSNRSSQSPGKKSSSWEDGCRSLLVDQVFSELSLVHSSM